MKSLDNIPESTTNQELQELQDEIDQTIAWIEESREELEIAESRLAYLKRRRDQLRGDS